MPPASRRFSTLRASYEADDPRSPPARPWTTAIDRRGLGPVRRCSGRTGAWTQRTEIFFYSSTRLAHTDNSLAQPAKRSRPCPPSLSVRCFTLHPGVAVMLTVLFWILFSLMLLIVIPDRWHARREIAKATSRLSSSPSASATCETGKSSSGKTTFACRTVARVMARSQRQT